MKLETLNLELPLKPLSRQRRWQLRNQAAGKCIACSRPAEPGKSRCPECREKNLAYLHAYRKS